MSDKLYSTHAEEALLSILLRNPEAVQDSLELNREAFSSIPNQVLFETIKLIHRDGLIPEYSMIVSTLEGKQLLAQAGGESYLRYLYNQDYGKEDNLKEFVKLVSNSYKTRSLISLCKKIPQTLNESGDIDYSLNYLQDKLLEIGRNGSIEEIVNIEQATRSAWEELVENISKDVKVSNTSGIKNLDSVTGGFLRGDTWVIAGRPGMGKSSLMVNSALSGVPTLIFSLEMRKELLVYRFLSILTGISAFNIRMGIVTQKELDTISEAAKHLKSLPIYIDGGFIRNSDYVFTNVRKYKNTYGIESFHIDYLQLLAERGESAVHEIGRITRMNKLISNDLNITGVLYSQLNRLVETREDKRPILSDLRQSGNIEEDVDIAVFIYRDSMYNKNTKDKNRMELIIAKHRNGPTGTVFATFNEDNMKIISEQ